MNVIFVRDFELDISIGIYPKEKQQKQRIIINIEGVLLENCNAFHTDEIQDTVSYEIFIDEARKLAQKKHFNTVEFFAEELSSQLLKDNHLKEISIQVEKPDIYKEGVGSVGVRITRPE